MANLRTAGMSVHAIEAQPPSDIPTPPCPPPKPSGHSSGRVAGLPAVHGQNSQSVDNGPHRAQHLSHPHERYQAVESTVVPFQPPDDGWLPETVKEKTTVDLQAILSVPALQQSLVHSPETAHPSLLASSGQIRALLSDNIALSTALKLLEAQIQHQRQSTQSRILSLRALERQWRSKQAEQDEALRDFSAPALYQRLSAAVSEQESLCRGLEESFLEGDGQGLASEREVGDFVRRLRETRKAAYLRRERKERWDEGRVGGWR